MLFLLFTWGLAVAFLGNRKLVGSGWLCGPTVWSLDSGAAVRELGPAMGDGHLVDLCVGSEGWITAIGDLAYSFWPDPGRAQPIILNRQASVPTAPGGPLPSGDYPLHL